MNRAQLADAYALTLVNPWAHMIAHRGKTVENRTWMPHQGVNWLLIHAGKGWEDSELGDMWQDSMEQVATSAIVAVADLAHACDRSRRNRHQLECGCNPAWAQPGQCHWVLGNVQALQTPVPARGRQGLWRPDPATLEAVAAQLVVGGVPR